MAGVTDQAPAPATPHEVRSLIWRLRVEIGLTNLVGVSVLLAGAAIFPAPGDQVVAATLGYPLTATAAAAIFVVAMVASHRLMAPLADWLEHGRAAVDAPPEIQRLVVAHPALQAGLILAVWWLAALGFAVVDALLVEDEPVRAFVQTVIGAGTAGLVTAMLSFLTDQRILGRWYGRFFVERQPTDVQIPSSRAGRRLVVAYVLGGAIPLALLGTVVSQRIDEPRGLERLELVVWFLVVVGIGAGLLLTLSVRQSVVRPITLIRAAADRVRQGTLEVSVPVESADEMGELAVAFNAMVEGLRERRRVEDLFGRHVGEAVLERALHEGVALGGERRTASILFLDLVGFTALSEDLDPEAVVERLNTVFDIAVDEVGRRAGLVNKFMGDAVLAVFGAPLEDPDHAGQALDAARAMAARLDAAGVAYGIGISTGPVVAGNVGSAERFEYTVVGDAVNEASRLQELTRDHHERVLVSGRTVAWLGADDGLVRFGVEVLRGRSHPTEIFTLV